MNGLRAAIACRDVRDLAHQLSIPWESVPYLIAQMGERALDHVAFMTPKIPVTVLAGAMGAAKRR